MVSTIGATTPRLALVLRVLRMRVTTKPPSRTSGLEPLALPLMFILQLQLLYPLQVHRVQVHHQHRRVLVSVVMMVVVVQIVKEDGVVQAKETARAVVVVSFALQLWCDSATSIERFELEGQLVFQP